MTKIDPARGQGPARRARRRDAAERSGSAGFPSPNFGCATVANDVVFTSTYDGSLYGLSVGDGSTLWTARMRAGVNACPSIAGDLLLVGAGVPTATGSVPELVAFGLG